MLKPENILPEPSAETDAYKLAYELGNLAIATIEKARSIPQLDRWMGKNAVVLGRLPPDIKDNVHWSASRHRIKLGGGAPLPVISQRSRI